MQAHLPLTLLCGGLFLLSVVAGRRVWTGAARGWGLVFLACVSGCAGAFWSLVFYPGLMSSDSLDYWRQALAGQYSDFQPPMPAFLMRLIIRVFGPQVAIYTVLQAAGFYLSALALIWALTHHQAAPARGRVRLLSSIVFLAHPVGWVYSVTLWKDVVFAAAACFLCACLLDLLGARRLQAAAGPVAFFAMALAARHDALSLLPATAALLYVGLKRARASPALRWGTLAALCAVVALPSAMNGMLGVRPSDRSVLLASVLIGYDETLERTEHVAHTPSASFWDEALGQGGYRRLMDQGWDCGDEWTFVLHPEVGRSRIRDAVRRNRAQVVGILADLAIRHPVAAVRHHLCVIAKLTGVAHGPAGYPYQADLEANDFGLVSASPWPAVRASALRCVDAIFDAGLCRHWLSLAALVSMLGMAVGPAGALRDTVLATLGLSPDTLVVLPAIGLSHFATFCLVPVAHDWRYLLFPTIAVVAMVGVAVAHVTLAPSAPRPLEQDPGRARVGR